MKRMVTFAARVSFIFGMALLLLPAPAAATPNDAQADHVLGQPNFSSNAGNNGGISAASLSGPKEIGIDSAARLWVADVGNSRVLEYDDPMIPGANREYGQPDFTSGGGNQGGTSASLLADPAGVAVAADGYVWIADTGNSRILGYADALNVPSASRVLGASDFVTRGSGVTSASTFQSPYELAAGADGRLWLADVGNHRVLEFDHPLTSDTADRVFGQTGFLASVPDSGSHMHSPTHVAIDAAGRLWVADTNNHRVLEYDDPLNNATPTRVFGQPDLTANTANNGGVSASSLFGPQAVAVDGAGHLWVADSANNRVLEYVTPLTSRAASRVFGQPDFASNSANNGGVSASSLSYPTGLALDSEGRLWVADQSNNRLLAFDGVGPQLPLVGGVAEQPLDALLPGSVHAKTPWYRWPPLMSAAVLLGLAGAGWLATHLRHRRVR